jgi:DNA-binding PadR family transcriptional regulator
VDIAASRPASVAIAPPEPPPALTEPAYIILVALMSRPAHGYRIMQIINDVFRTSSRLGPGTLYRTLQRLEAAGLIDEVEAIGESEDERRRAYRLTPTGRTAVQEEVRRLDALVRLAKTQLAVSDDRHQS